MKNVDKSAVFRTEQQAAGVVGQDLHRNRPQKRALPRAETVRDAEQHEILRCEEVAPEPQDPLEIFGSAEMF